jgi:phosphoribosylglycinamide formyltransferase-1
LQGDYAVGYSEYGICIRRYFFAFFARNRGRMPDVGLSIMNKFRLAIFASGSGTNAQEIINYFKNHAAIEVALVLSNNPKAYVLTRAADSDIPSRIFDKQIYLESEQILDWLRAYQVTHVVLAGFLWLVPPYLIRAYPHRIINIHPALLPKYGGKGMYGTRIHELVKSSGEVETGITIHLVDDNYDEGRILFQAQCVVEPTDTPQTIAAKVHELEYRFYPKIIEKMVIGRP